MARQGEPIQRLWLILRSVLAALLKRTQVEVSISQGSVRRRAIVGWVRRVLRVGHKLVVVVARRTMTLFVGVVVVLGETPRVAPPPP
jgi:hypothetical protein